MQQVLLSLSLNRAAIIKNWGNDPSNLMAQQIYFVQTLNTVQTANDRKFVLLGSEISKVQKNIKAIRDIVENHFIATSRPIDQLIHSLYYFARCVVHTKHFSNLVFKLKSYTWYLDLVYTFLNVYRSALVSYRTFFYSSVSSLSSGYVTHTLLTPNHLAEIVHELTMEEVHCGTKLTPAIPIGYEATYYEVQIVLEVFILASGISVVTLLNSENPWIQSLPPSTSSVQFHCISPMRIVLLLPCINSVMTIYLLGKTKLSTANLVLPCYESVLAQTESGSVVKDFSLPQMRPWSA